MVETNQNIEIALQKAARLLSVHAYGVPRFGWNRKSAGRRVIDKRGERLWLRVQSKLVDARENIAWSGIREANSISGVRKPTFFRGTDWTEGTTKWRADLMSYVDSEKCSDTAHLTRSIGISGGWLVALRDSLTQLGRHDTARINTRQDLVSRRIRERFGERIDGTVEVWTTVHGDIHWSNLTAPDMWILDWEGWGRGPFGLDAAFLYVFSLLEPPVARQIRDTFSDWLNTTDGIRSQLFVCAELLRMIELHGDHPELRSPIDTLARELLLSAPQVKTQVR